MPGLTEEELNAQENPIIEDTSSAAPQTVEVPDDTQGSEGVEPKATDPAPETDQPVSNPAWFKPEAFKMKYRGQDVAPRDYQHAVNLMQQGYSYTEAMTQLKREKEEFETQKGKYTQYEQLENAFKSNPAFAQKIWQMYQEAQQGGAPQGAQPPAQQDPQYQQLFQTVSQMQQRLQVQDQQQADQAVKQEIEDVKAKLPGVQWDQVTETGHSLLYDVLNYAHTGKFPSLMAAARDYLWDSQVGNAKMAGAQQAANAKKRAAKEGVVSQGASNPVQPGSKKVNIKDVSYDDLAVLALKSLGKA